LSNHGCWRSCRGFILEVLRGPCSVRMAGAGPRGKSHICGRNVRFASVLCGLCCPADVSSGGLADGWRSSQSWVQLAVGPFQSMRRPVEMAVLGSQRKSAQSGMVNAMNFGSCPRKTVGRGRAQGGDLYDGPIRSLRSTRRTDCGTIVAGLRQWGNCSPAQHGAPHCESSLQSVVPALWHHQWN